MTTRNLVPRADNEGKLGISSKKWSELNATTANLTTLKISSLKLNAVADLDFLTNGAGIEAITANNDGQFVVALDDIFLTDRIGFNADGTKPDFTLPNGDPLPGNSVILATDTLVEAIQKLNDDLRDVAAPSDLTVNSFNVASITTSLEAFADNDTTLMTSAAIDDRILSYGYTTNTGDITSIINGTGLDLDGGDGLSGNVTIKLSDTTVTAGDYGSGTQIPTFTVDAQGRLTAAGTQAISTSFDISDGNVNDTFNVGETLTFAGGTGLETAVTNNRVTTTLSDTTVTAGAYGSATEIPTFTVDAQGRLTAAATVGITTTLTVDVDGVGTQDVSLAADALQILGGTGISSSIVKVGNDVTVTLGLDDTAVAAAQYGDANSVSQFTVDAQGRLTQAANVDISITSSQVNDATAVNIEDKIVLRDANGDFAAGTITATLSGNASSASKWDEAITLTLGTDLSGSVDIDGDGNVTLDATIAPNSVALGTDTTGNYVGTITAGNGLSSTGAETGEGIAHTISVDGVLAQLNNNLAELADGDDDGKFIVATGDNTFAYESGATVRTSLGLGVLSPLVDENDEVTALSVSKNLSIDNQGSLILKELNANAEGDPATVKSISIQAPAQLTDSYSLTLPANDGDLNQILTTDGSGVLSWSTVNAIVDAVDSFSTIAVAGQQNVLANGSEETLTLANGNGISITTAAATDTITIAVSGLEDGQIAAIGGAYQGIANDKIATITAADKVSLSALNIDDGAIEIGAALADDDLIIVDDGASGTNRSSRMSRVATYIRTKDSEISSIGSENNTVSAEGSLSVAQDLTVTGNLVVNGSQFQVDGTTVQLDDNLIELGLVDKAAPTGATTKDLGLMLHRHDGANASKLAFYWDESVDKFKLESGITESDGVIDAGGTTSTLVANLEGDVTGNADTSSEWSTARTVTFATGEVTGSFSIKGNADVSDVDLSISGESVTNAMLAGSIADGKLAQDYIQTTEVDDSSIEFDSGSLNVKALGITNAMLAGSIADGKLAQDYIQTTEVDDSSIEFDSGSLNIKALGVTNAMLAGSIADGKLAQDYIQTSEVDDSSIEFDSGSLNIKALGVTNAMLAGSISNDKLAGSIADGKLAQDYIQTSEVDDSSIEFDSGSLNVKALGITNDMLAGSIADGKLAQNYIQTSEVDDSSIEFSEGSLNVKAAGITDAMLATDYIQTGEVDDSSIEFDSGSLNIKALGVTNAMLAGSIADGKLAQDYIQTSEVDDSSIEFNGGSLNVKALGITNAMLAGSIADSKLSNISTENKVKISSLDIDEANISVNSVALADSIIIDQSSNGTNRTATLTRLRDLFQTENIITSLPSLATVGTITSGTWNGTAITNDKVANDLTIDGGSVNNSPIGASSHSTGKFTTLQATTSLQLASGATITGINDTDNMNDASATTIATSESIKAYVDAQITAQDLDFTTDTVDEGNSKVAGAVDLDSQTLALEGTTNKLSVTHSNQTITFNVGSDIVQLDESQTLTNKTLTSPVASGLSLSDSSIVFEGATSNDFETTLTVEDPTADREITIPDATDTLVGRATTDTLTNKSIDADNNTITNLEVDNLKDGVLDTDLSSVAETDTTLATAKAIKAYIDSKLGRHGGIFLSSQRFDGANDTEGNAVTDDNGDNIYDVVFDSSPLVRSHFGPFAFDLQQLRDSAFGGDDGSDIIFYASRSFQSSDRHFEVLVRKDSEGNNVQENGSDVYDTVFTGADSTTP